jgi:AAA+ ATPase superfamily predicted ATPase
MMLINRESELSMLQELRQRRKAVLLVLYGRRRVGKTELLRELCADREHLFFIATLSSDRDQLSALSQQIWGYTHTDVPEGFTFPSWESAFRALIDLPGRPIVVLDEFSYLVSGNKSIPSILQKVWDEALRATGVFLILCG